MARPLFMVLLTLLIWLQGYAPASANPQPCGTGTCPSGFQCTADARCMPANAAQCGRPGVYCPSGSFCSEDGQCVVPAVGLRCVPGNVPTTAGGCRPASYSDCGDGRSCPPGTSCKGDGTCSGPSGTGEFFGIKNCQAGFLCAPGNRCYDPQVTQLCRSGLLCAKPALCGETVRTCLYGDTIPQQIAFAPQPAAPSRQPATAPGKREDRLNANCAAIIGASTERGINGETLPCVEVGSRCGRISVYYSDSSIPGRVLAAEANPNMKYCATRPHDTVNYVGFCPREPLSAFQACYRKLGIK